MDLFLWGIFPYLVGVILIGGLIWRYRYDQFGWTTRSSQVYESKILKIASPLFHFSLIAVFLGHVIGLLIPKALTDWIGISQHAYHMGALWGGTAAGVALLIGLILLIVRRRSISSVFRATTKGDKLMYLVLAAVIGVGIFATLTGDTTPAGEPHNYRETVSVWFRSLMILQPDIAAMAQATWQFKVHVILGLLLFLITPFTRLVHAFSAPFHYLFRPYIVYRSKDKRKRKSLTAAGRGWDPIQTRSQKDE